MKTLLGLLALAAVAALLLAGAVDPAAGASTLLIANVAAADLKALEQAMREVFKEMGTQVRDLRAQVLDLAQRGTVPPQMDGGASGGVAAGKIVEALQNAHGFNALAGREQAGKVTIELGADVYRGVKNAIITGDSPSTRPLVNPDRDTSQIYAPAPRRLTVEQLLPSVPTTSNATQFTQEATFTSNAAPQGGTASPTPPSEGEALNASDMSFTLTTSNVVTIGHHFTISVQALDDAPALQQHIETRGIYGLQLEVEDELLNGTGAAGKLSGLINQATAFNRSSSSLTRADVLRKAVTQLLLSYHQPTGVVINPQDDEAIDLQKDSQNRYIMIKVGDRIWQVPVVSTAAIAVGKFLMGDFALAGRIRDRQSVSVSISTEHADYFTRMLAMVRIHRRLGLEVHRPLALVYGDYAGSV